MGVNPNAIISHRLGEYAALQMSGVLSISDAIFLISHRAHLLETRCQAYTHSILAVSETSAVLRPLLSTFSEDDGVACSNSPRETVFAGRREVIVSGLSFLHDQGFSINWSEYLRDLDQTHRLLTLPSYAFDNEGYWAEYRNVPRLSSKGREEQILPSFPTKGSASRTNSPLRPIDPARVRQKGKERVTSPPGTLPRTIIPECFHSHNYFPSRTTRRYHRSA
jgi:acyl transferase domain-containing protein